MKRFFDRFKWVFVLIGVGGNLLFFIGSVCFLSGATEKNRIWLFIIGSCTMLISTVVDTWSAYLASTPADG